MARPKKTIDVQAEYQEELSTLIPRLLNELGTIAATAKQLGTSPITIQRWVKRLGYVRKCVWVKAEVTNSNN